MRCVDVQPQLFKDSAKFNGESPEQSEKKIEEEKKRSREKHDLSFRTYFLLISSVCGPTVVCSFQLSSVNHSIVSSSEFVKVPLGSGSRDLATVLSMSATID